MSHYKPYPAYKDSGVEWIGKVPEHWEVKRFKFAVSSSKNGIWGDDPNEVEDIKCVRVADFDRDTLGISKEIPTVRAVPLKDREGRLLRRGNLLLEKSGGGENQPVGQVVMYDRDDEAVCSNFIARIELVKDVPPKFWNYSFAAAYYVRLNLRSVKQTSGIQNLDQEQYLSEYATFPPIDEQAAIVAAIDRETARIDALIAKKTEFIGLLKKKIVALASQPPDSPNLKWVRLSHVCEVISRPVLQQAGNSYTKLGLFNRGRGIFKRDETDTEDMGDSEFFWIQPGDLILSGQFAWEGAVALANEEHAGCVVSHRFPVIRGRKNEALTEYLLAYFLTAHGDFVLNDCSRGSAGRNRPLNMNLLLGWKIPIPSMQIQREIERLVQLERRIGEKVSKSIDLLQKRRAALITAAVTGQIDLRESA